MDATVDSLRSRTGAWTATSVSERIAILDELIADFAAVAASWVEASLEDKGTSNVGSGATEEWAAGPYGLLRYLRLLRRSLVDIEAHGRPRIPGPVTTRSKGQVVARVFPQTVYDRLLFRGVTTDVWMEPDVAVVELARTQAMAYQSDNPTEGVALVLGAGNYSSIGPMDALYKLFVEGRAVLLKPSPLAALATPFVEQGFRSLIERGFLRVVFGETEEGTYLCAHPGVDEVHVTGSHRTFESIVFGTGPEGAQRMAAGEPLLPKPVTAELGNVSPLLVVPGPWNEGDLSYQAEHIVTSLTANGGCNCNATQVLIQHAGWGGRPMLLERIRRLLAGVSTRSAFYPGVAGRQRSFVDSHPDAELFGSSDDAGVPWGLVAGVDPEDPNDVCYTTEAFCGLIAETAIDAAGVPEYLEQAVQLANDRLWGTLCATLIVHPASLRDPAVAEAVERAIADLRYGTVAVNYWAAASYVMGTGPWGAFPGHEVDDIQSGTGFVHNALMFSRPQKTVLRAPFRVRPTPPWFATHGHGGARVFRKLAAFEAAPSVWKLPGILWAALRA